MQLTKTFIDFARSNRVFTDEGYLIVPSTLARTGIQQYRAFELGLTDRDPLAIVSIYRSADEVFAQDAIASFENKPVTNNHPDEFVDASNWKDLTKGFARNVRRQGNLLVGDLIIADKELIDLVQSGKVEISNGYTAEYDWTPGITPDGQRYDAQQRNIRGNHVAIVDAARCGPACRVSDSNPNGENPMTVRKVTVDGIPFELPEAAAAAVDKVVEARDTAVKASQDAAAALANAETKHKQALDAKDAEIAQLKKDVLTPDQRDALVEQWATLTADAQRLVPNFDHKGKTCDTIRREVLTELQKDSAKAVVIGAALAGKKIEDASADAIKVAFNVVAAAAPMQDRKAADPVAAALAGAGSKNTSDSVSPRDAYIARMNDGLKSNSDEE